MSWGIDFTADIFISRQDFNENPSLVQDKIIEANNDLSMIKSKIQMFASSNFSELIPEDWKDEPIDWLYNKLADLFEYYDELYSMKFKLELYLDYLKHENPKQTIKQVKTDWIDSTSDGLADNV